MPFTTAVECVQFSDGGKRDDKKDVFLVDIVIVNSARVQLGACRHVEFWKFCFSRDCLQ